MFGKRLSLVLLVMLLVLSMMVPATKAAEPLKVAFVYIGPVDDMGWTYMHDKARQQLEKEFHIEIAYIESVQPGNDIERNLRDYARNGYNVIFATANNYYDAVVKVAAEYPETKFFVIEGPPDSPTPNIEGYFPRMYQATYLGGMVAATKSKSGHLGFVAAYPVPQVVKNINAFALGAQRVNSSAVVHVVWTNTWYEPPREKEAAIALGDVCDVIAQHQDSAAVQMAAEELGIFGIGYDSDEMIALAPKATLAVPTFNWYPYYSDRLRAIQNGTWVSSRFFGGFESGTIDLVYGQIPLPKELTDEVDTVIAAMTLGEWDPFTGPIYNQAGELVIDQGVRLDDTSINSMRWFVKGVVGSLD
jgi:basic membrane protein A and related proteins